MKSFPNKVAVAFPVQVYEKREEQMEIEEEGAETASTTFLVL